VLDVGTKNQGHDDASKEEKALRVSLSAKSKISSGPTIDPKV
jgi:hypothetical protein